MITNKQIGYVTHAQEYLLELEGLPNCAMHTIIYGPNNAIAQITAIHEKHITALMLNHAKPRPGDEFVNANAGIQIPNVQSLPGRIIDPLGNSLDLGAPLTPITPVNLQEIAGGIGTRATITTQFITGLTAIDILLPIARGQRELILGEPHSGKAQFLTDTIANQRNALPKTICIYAAIGKSEIDTRRFIQSIQKVHAQEYTIIVAALSSQPAPLIALAPAVAMSIAEEFKKLGIDTLVFFDDMSTHAKYLREITLLSSQPPGRELYPGDIFYQQARLFERAGNFAVDSTKSVSITLLPLIEINRENYTGLIATNIMGSTDGHILFASELHSEGHYPAVLAHGSVTRLGHQTQRPLNQELANNVSILLAEYRQMSLYNRFGTSTANATLLKGQVATEFLKQEPGTALSIDTQTLLMALPFSRLFDTRDKTFVVKHKHTIIKNIQTQKFLQDLMKKFGSMKFQELLDALNTDEIRAALLEGTK